MGLLGGDSEGIALLFDSQPFAHPRHGLGSDTGVLMVVVKEGKRLIGIVFSEIGINGFVSLIRHVAPILCRHCRPSGE